MQPGSRVFSRRRRSPVGRGAAAEERNRRSLRNPRLPGSALRPDGASASGGAAPRARSCSSRSSGEGPVNFIARGINQRRSFGRREKERPASELVRNRLSHEVDRSGRARRGRCRSTIYRRPIYERTPPCRHVIVPPPPPPSSWGCSPSSLAWKKVEKKKDRPPSDRLIELYRIQLCICRTRFDCKRNHYRFSE